MSIKDYVAQNPFFSADLEHNTSLFLDLRICRRVSHLFEQRHPALIILASKSLEALENETL
jgi:hypothetical protein